VDEKQGNIGKSDARRELEGHYEKYWAMAPDELLAVEPQELIDDNIILANFQKPLPYHVALYIQLAEMINDFLKAVEWKNRFSGECSNQAELVAKESSTNGVRDIVCQIGCLIDFAVKISTPRDQIGKLVANIEKLQKIVRKEFFGDELARSIWDGYLVRLVHALGNQKNQ
jgi:hypothetical protein